MDDEDVDVDVKVGEWTVNAEVVPQVANRARRTFLLQIIFLNEKKQIE